MATNIIRDGKDDGDTKEQFAGQSEEVKDSEVCDEGKELDEAGESEGEREEQSEEASEGDSEEETEDESEGDEDTDEDEVEVDDGDLDYEGSGKPYYGAEDDGYWVPDSDYEEDD
ncbi:hypothetical protein PRZ48_010704 [Zasmidium cellare]|uniref:Uncharacterized protein n=1 Tax=Zasmidium cellare TaxID=395010 RepID=A0ABR0E9E0_ZASCE|nr:hypothetical protein PRZ48_010704 [Zasmidium cellare]